MSFGEANSRIVKWALNFKREKEVGKQNVANTFSPGGKERNKERKRGFRERKAGDGSLLTTVSSCEGRRRRGIEIERDNKINLFGVHMHTNLYTYKTCM